MTVDWIVLGSCPLSEPTCYNNDDWAKEYSRKVLLAWLRQLRRTFPEYLDRITVRSISDNIETSEYFVVIDFDNMVEFESAKYVADNLPYCWDEEAKKELGKGYFEETIKIYCKEK